MGTNGEKPERPVFDFSRVSKQWNKEFGLSASKASRAQNTLGKPYPVNGDAAAIEAYFAAQDAAFSVIEETGDIQANLLAQVLDSVPRGWLLESAPEEIDWHDPASLNYIQSHRYMELLEMLQNGEARRNSKN